MSEYCMKCMLPLEENEICPHCGFVGENSEQLHLLRPGTVLNERYLIGNALGQGGFGITYIGRDLKLQMRVAVKEYYPNGYSIRNSEVTARVTAIDRGQTDFIENGKQKFLKEARALAQFHDISGVVDVRDFFEDNHTAYIVMEYLDGEDLRTHLKYNCFPADIIFAMMKPVMESLVKIHQAGIIHRDISPDNIMMLKNGTLKLMDFGAARLLDYSDQRSVSVVLKGGYAPEEQYRPKGLQGPWTDIYALCATIYKCMTGITPEDALQRSCGDEIVWPSEMGIPITALQESVLKKGMALKQEDRFQSVEEMIQALERKGNIFSMQNQELQLRDDEDDSTEYWSHESADSEDEPVDQEVDPVDLDTDSFWKKKRTFLFFGAVVLLGLLAVFGRKKEADPEAVNASEVVIGESDQSVPDTEMRHVTLTAGDHLLVREYQEAVAQIKGRLDIFAGEGNYQMKEIEDGIDLLIPESAFRGMDPERIFRCYLTRPIDLYAFAEQANYQEDYFALKRSDLEEVTLEFGTIEGADVSDRNVDPKGYPYVKIVLTEGCATKHQETIQRWGDKIRFGQDIEMKNTTWYYYNTYPVGDGRTFYVLNDDAGGAFCELLVYNLTRESIPDSFYFGLDLEDKVIWEQVETASVKGKNQCNLEEMSGKTVTIRYRNNSLGETDLTQGQILDLNTALKHRLDAFQIPYSFGWTEKDPASDFIIRIGADPLNEVIMSLLTAQYYSLQAGLRSVTVSSVPSFVLEKNGDGTWIGRLNLAEYKAKDLISIMEDEKQKIYLMVSELPLLEGYLEESETGISVRFERFLEEEWTEITEEDQWILQLWDCIIDGIEMPAHFVVDGYQINPDETGEKVPQDAFLTTGNALLEEMRQNILTIREEAVVYANGTAVQVSLHLPVDENFSQRSVSIVKEIYEKSGFEDSIYSDMNIYLMEEVERDRERARFYFDKAYYNGTVLCAGVIDNGRLEPYKEEIKNLLKEDFWFTRFTEGLWQFEY